MEKEKKTTKAAEKTTETKKKAAVLKEEVKKEVKKAVKETKKTAEKAVAAVEKTATAAKTRAKKKAAPAEEFILEYAGKQVNVEILVAAAKADWIANGHEEKNYVSCKLYMKPEDRRAYYVINDTDEGNVPC